MKLNGAFAAAVLSIVGILIVPLPPPVLDVLLALNIFGSALVLLISLRVEEPLEFSAFSTHEVRLVSFIPGLPWIAGPVRS